MEPQNQQTSQPENELSSSEAGTTPSPIAAALQRARAEWVSEVVEALGETTIVVPREFIADACLFLKTTSGLEFNFLSDLCGFDRGPEEEPRFEVNYHLFSTTTYRRLRLKVLLNEDDVHVPTVSSVSSATNCPERESYDLFGVVLVVHPDPHITLLPE